MLKGVISKKNKNIRIVFYSLVSLLESKQ